MLAAGSVWLRKRSWKTLKFNETKRHFKTYPIPLAWPHGSLPLWIGSLCTCMWFVVHLLPCLGIAVVWQILTNIPHYPSFLSLAIHTWCQEDGSRCSQDPSSRLPGPSVLPKPNRFIYNQKKKKIKYIVLNIWKCYLKRQFFKKKKPRFKLNVYYPAADEQFTHSQVNVSDFIHFFYLIISLWNAELLTTLMSV